MKILVLNIAFIGLFLLTSCSTTKNSKVYVCTGRYSTAYHKDINCKGLNRCGAEVIEVDKSEAINNGRHKCGFCY